MANLEEILKSLGFSPLPRLTAAEEEQKAALLAKLTAAEGGPRVEPKECVPHFFYIKRNTFAICSADSRWYKHEIVDLSSWGFADVNYELTGIIEKL
jgi:hypothetical protein